MDDKNVHTSASAVVLHSGGLDSTVCLLLALRSNRTVLSLGLDYGQRHRIELDYAHAQCSRFRVERRVLRIEWEKPERTVPVDRTLDEIKQGVSPAFLPARNIVFLSLAAAEAAGVGASEIWIGVNAVDYSGYPDCRPSFLKVMSQVLEEGIAINVPELRAPLVKMSKPEIARLGRDLGLERGDTWSCYAPVIGEGAVRICGRCDACVLHAHAWDSA